MFRRLQSDLPNEASFEADPKQLGMGITPDGRFIDLKRAESKTANDPYFTLYHTDDERTNELRKEAVHECARVEIMSRLMDLQMLPHYVKGDQIFTGKPEKEVAHIEVLASLRAQYKKNIIVVVGEHTQDMGVWAWRHLMRDGGVDGGSAVGLVKEIKKMYGGTLDGGIKGANKHEHFPKFAVELADNSELYFADHESMDYKNKVYEKDEIFQGSKDHFNSALENSAPGLVLLNPGQLNYSPSLHTSMGMAQWNARRKPNVTSDSITIDSTHNKVPGHRDPVEHVTTMFKSIMPKILSGVARGKPEEYYFDHPQLYIVGVSDGSEYVIKALDSIVKADEKRENERQLGQDSVHDLEARWAESLLENIAAFCLIQPTHNYEHVETQAVRELLATKGKAYMLDEKPMATLLGEPKKRSVVKPELTAMKLPSAHQPLKTKSTSNSKALSVTVDHSGSQNEAAAANSESSNGEDSTDEAKARDKALLAAAKNIVPEDNLGDEEDELNVLTNNQLSITDKALSEGAAARQKAEKEVVKEDDEAVDEFKDAYAHVKFSCPTYSCGRSDFTEMIWPTVMEDVLKWFKSIEAGAAEDQDTATAAGDGDGVGVKTADTEKSAKQTLNGGADGYNSATFAAAVAAAPAAAAAGARAASKAKERFADGFAKAIE